MFEISAMSKATPVVDRLTGILKEKGRATAGSASDLWD